MIDESEIVRIEDKINCLRIDTQYKDSTLENRIIQLEANDYITLSDADMRMGRIEADITCNVSSIYRELEELKEKVEAMAQQVKFARGLMRDKPDRFNIRITQGIYLDNLGGIYFALDDSLFPETIIKEQDDNIFLKNINNFDIIQVEEK